MQTGGSRVLDPRIALGGAPGWNGAAPAWLEPPSGGALSFAAYQSSLDQRLVEPPMSDRGSDNTGENPRPLAKTWEMSLDLLTRQGYDLARPLLRLIACFAAAPLPYRRLIRPEILQQSPLFPNATPTRLSSCLRALAGPLCQDQVRQDLDLEH